MKMLIMIVALEARSRRYTCFTLGRELCGKFFVKANVFACLYMEYVDIINYKLILTKGILI